MIKISDVVQDTAGNALAGVSITVKLAGTDTLATLYSDEGVTPLANPVTTDSVGVYSFYVAYGDYDLTPSKAGYTGATRSDFTVGAAQELALGTAAALNVPASGDAAAGEVVKGSDSRLSDARAPTTHTHAQYAALAVAETFTAAQRGAVTALTSSAASIAIDLAATNNFSHTLTENTTLAAPTNPVAGQSGVIALTQHASAPKTLAYNAFWKFAGGTVPTLTASNGALDILSYYVVSATVAVCSLSKGVA